MAARLTPRGQARAELSTAIELYRAMDMPFWLPQAEAALAYMERLKPMSDCDSRACAQAPTLDVGITSVSPGIQAYLRP
jgi:hypothetical protein